MKFAKLQQMAQVLTDEEMIANLRSLVNDQRFAAMLRLLAEQKELASDHACQLRFAGSHGCLAHAAGVRYCALELEGKIRELCDPPKKRNTQPPPEVG